MIQRQPFFIDHERWRLPSAPTIAYGGSLASGYAAASGHVLKNLIPFL